jgi:sugar phosphate isomerase/epimerase
MGTGDGDPQIGSLGETRMLGISTSWWQDRGLRGEEIVSEAVDLGFAGLELDYRITEAMFQRMKPVLRRSVPVLSVHNIFPVPQDRGIRAGIADHFLLSSLDPEERSLAVRYGIRTIEHAHEVEAKAVVLHLGKVEMDDPTRRLKKFYESGRGMEAEEVCEFLETQRRLRGEKRQRNLDAVLFSLERLNREAEKKGVLLGIENRYHFHEIPDLEEIGLILHAFRGGSIRYWHDVGHAAALEVLGVMKQMDLLSTYRRDMIGIHLHDAKGLEDHLAPGQGEIDFRALAPFLSEVEIKVLEVHPKGDERALEEGLWVLKEAGIS